MERTLNQYIFITTEGDTIAPNPDYPVGNCQVLGIVDAADETEARQKLLEENPWIEPSGFDITQARCIQLLRTSL